MFFSASLLSNNHHDNVYIYMISYFPGITPSSVRQMILSSTTDVVDTSKLWDATDVDCGSAHLSHDIFRRRVHDNITKDCFQKVCHNLVQ
jgi:hypothetical protein